MCNFATYVPESSVKILQSWIDELDIDIKIVNPRKTKLGDFRFSEDISLITINNNLNKYSFLITLTHELAHAFIFRKYKKTVLPHGKRWQLKFRSMLLCFLNPNCFPDEILIELSRFLIKPKASTYSDHKLTMALKKHDTFNSKFIVDLKQGEIFQFSKGRLFIKGKLVRKRFRCKELKTNKIYLFHPYAEIQNT